MANACGLLFDDRFQRHLTTPTHPEKPARLDAVRAGLQAAGLFDRLPRIAPRPATDEELRRVHTPEYIARLIEACAKDAPMIDTADSRICPESEQIARLAAGGVIEAALQVAAGTCRRAFCAVRPPGHHAEAGESMGFCLYGNVALAARALQAEAGLKRILILDWDVHHGNGTQHAFDEDPGVFFISLHGHPDRLYPYTGFEYERGIGAGRGYTMNCVFGHGDGDVAYRHVFEEKIEPAVREYRPEMILISCGFDAHEDDPLGITALTDEMFGWMTRRVLDWAGEFSDGRVLSVLEGGYNLPALERCTAVHVGVLAGEQAGAAED
jgi:acetoin utilization deacetylase AcuC-like enzyme